jgi:hypothetical protein
MRFLMTDKRSDNTVTNSLLTPGYFNAACDLQISNMGKVTNVFSFFSWYVNHQCIVNKCIVVLRERLGSPSGFCWFPLFKL